MNANTYETLDDLLYDVYENLITLPSSVTTTRSATLGNTSEIIGTTLVLSNPRARLSRSEIKK